MLTRCMLFLPFEKAFYAKFDVDVTFVGHPLIDAVEQFKTQFPSRETFLSENDLASINRL